MSKQQNRFPIARPVIACLIACAGTAGAQQADARLGEVVVDAAGNAAPARFAQVEGAYEFSGRMIVRPMQAAFGDEPARFQNGGIPEGRLGALVPMSPARERLVAQAIEHFADVDEYVVTVPAGMNENTYADQLLATGDYEYAEPDYICHPALVPNDPRVGSQWHHNNMNNFGAWDIGTGSQSVIVAIVDSGIDLDHPDFVAALVPGFNSRSNQAQLSGGDVNDQGGHGSFCAGMAAARGNDGFGTAGVAFNAGLMPIKATGSSGGTAFSSDLNQGARWAVDNGAKSINVSFSGVQSSSVQTTGAYVEANGGLYFRSAGNDGAASLNFEHPNVIVVGATSAGDAKAGFSNTGPGLDIVAPGANVRAASLGGSDGVSSGTSFSSPAAAGAAALIFAANPSLSPSDIRNIMYNTARDLGTPGEDNSFGHGIVDSVSAMIAATGICPPIEITQQPPSLTTVCAGAQTVLSVQANGGNLSYEWSGPNGFTAQGAGVLIGLIDESKAGIYTVTVSNGCDDPVVSDAAVIEVSSPATITQQPQNQTVEEGDTLMLSVGATGGGISYTWSTPNGQIEQSSDTLVIENVTYADEGAYVVNVQGACGNGEDSLVALVDVVPVSEDCAADTNNDGSVTPADFTAWISAFNSQSSACDQNGDGSCNPADFNAFILNFNAGC